MRKMTFYKNMWFLVLLTLAIYFGGIFYFHDKGATFEQCVAWPVPWLFIGSIVLPPIQFLAEKIFNK